MAGHVVGARLDVGREGDSYQINKMEWNKNNANAINAVSIGRFSLLFCCCWLETCRSRPQFKKKPRRWLRIRRLRWIETASSADLERFTNNSVWLGDGRTGKRSQSPINRCSCYSLLILRIALLRAPATHNEHIFCQKEVTAIDDGNCLWKKRKLIEEEGTKEKQRRKMKTRTLRLFDLQEFVDLRWLTRLYCRSLLCVAWFLHSTSNQKRNWLSSAK